MHRLLQIVDGFDEFLCLAAVLVEERGDSGECGGVGAPFRDDRLGQLERPVHHGVVEARPRQREAEPRRSGGGRGECGGG